MPDYKSDEWVRPDVVGFALEILEMQRTIEDQAREIEHLKFFKEKYHECVNSSIKHNEKMMGTMLKTLLTPGVVCMQEEKTFIAVPPIEGGEKC